MTSTASAAYTNLKAKLEAAQAEKNKALGAREELLRRLKDEFGCKTIEEARELLEEKRQAHSKLSKKLLKMIENFEEAHGDRLT